MLVPAHAAQRRRDLDRRLAIEAIEPSPERTATSGIDILGDSDHGTMVTGALPKWQAGVVPTTNLMCSREICGAPPRNTLETPSGAMSPPPSGATGSAAVRCSGSGSPAANAPSWDARFAWRRSSNSRTLHVGSPHPCSVYEFARSVGPKTHGFPLLAFARTCFAGMTSTAFCRHSRAGGNPYGLSEHECGLPPCRRR